MTPKKPELPPPNPEDVLRKMLNTPPEPHVKAAKKKAKKPAK